MAGGELRVPMEILGLPLSAALRRAIADQLWTAPTNRQTLKAVFDDEAPIPQFYNPREMERETRNLRDDPRDIAQYFLGKPPHDIDPHRCLLIGDLGPDQPFALDYRQNPAQPRVVYHHRSMFWIEVASDIDTLFRHLGLRSDGEVNTQ